MKFMPEPPAPPEWEIRVGIEVWEELRKLPPPAVRALRGLRVVLDETLLPRAVRCVR